MPRWIVATHADAVAVTASLLREGLVVALPTDTVYGYAAAIDRGDAIERLYTLKKRSDRKPIPVLLSDIKQMPQVAQEMPGLAIALAQAFWPGGLTMVIEARDDLHPHLTAVEQGKRTVAVRIPDLAFTRDVISALGGALAVTSANRSGEMPALSATDIEIDAAHTADAIVDGGRVTGGVASTIVRISDHGLEILRHGAISTAKLEEALAGHTTR